MAGVIGVFAPFVFGLLPGNIDIHSLPGILVNCADYCACAAMRLRSFALPLQGKNTLDVAGDAALCAANGGRRSGIFVASGQARLGKRLARDLFSLDYGPIQLERTLAIVILVHVFYNFAIALRILTGYWSTQSVVTEEAARTLGAGEWAIWRDIRLPLVQPALLSASALIFMFTFTSFGVVLILGGIRFATLEVQIYYQAVSIFNLPMAAALSLVQIVAMFLMMVVYTRVQRSVQLSLLGGNVVARRANGRWQQLQIRIMVAFVAVLLFSPLLALILRSILLDGSLNIDNFAALSRKSRGSLLFITPLESVREFIAIRAYGNRVSADSWSHFVLHDRPERASWESV